LITAGALVVVGLFSAQAASADPHCAWVLNSESPPICWSGVGAGAEATDWTDATAEAWLFDAEPWAAEISGDCDPAETGTVALDATNVMQGSAAASFAESSDLIVDCSGVRDGGDGATTFWVRPGADATARVVWWTVDNSLAVAIGQFAGPGMAPEIITDNTLNATSSASYASAEFTFACVSYDSAGGEATLYRGEPDGTWSGDVTTDSGTQTARAAVDPGNDLRIGHSASLGLVGQLDELTWWGTELTESQCRRIYACGLDGSLCTCSGSTYTSTGRQADATGLPDCDAAAPGGESAALDWSTGASEGWEFETDDWLAEINAGCDLTATGTPSVDSSSPLWGSGSVLFDDSEALTTSCSEALYAGDVTTTGWLRRRTTDRENVYDSQGSGPAFNGIRLFARDQFACDEPEPEHCLRAYADTQAEVASDFSATSTTLAYYWCISHDDSAGTVAAQAVMHVGTYDGETAAWLGDVSVTDNAFLHAPRETPDGPMTFGANGGIDAIGELDSVWLWDSVLTEAQCRRIFACGVDGAACTCSGSSYAATGIQADATGLPTCDAVAP
jgi:hypothetical protein